MTIIQRNNESHIWTNTLTSRRPRALQSGKYDALSTFEVVLVGVVSRVEFCSDGSGGGECAGR